MADATTVSAKEAVEAVLSDRAMSEPGFVEKLMLDPAGVIRPLIADTIQDDGAVDLSGTSISAHVETDTSLHFVVTLESGEDEVSGFASLGRIGDMGLAGSFRAMRVAAPTMSASDDGDSHTDKNLCTASGVCVCTGSPCA